MKQIFNYITNYLPAALILILGFGCESLVENINIEGEDPKIVISAVLNPTDSFHTIYVTGSTPTGEYINQDNEYIDNATLKISNGTDELVISLTNKEPGEYGFTQVEFPIVHNVEYSISCSVPGFTKSVSAKCTVPEQFTTQIELLSFDSTNSIYEERYDFRLRFKDHTGKGDYYHVKGLVKLYDNYSQSSYSRETYHPDSNKKLFFTDDEGDGSWIKFSLSTWNNGSPNISVTGIYITLLKTDENYYKFFSVISDGVQLENPFAEPVIPFSNIENGYGVFSGVTEHKVYIPL